MNDSVFIVCLFYLILASTFIGLMPDDFFSGGSAPTELNADNIKDSAPTGILDSGKGFTFWGKIVAFLFVPITIAGVPLIIGLMLQLMNIVIIIFMTIYGIKVFWSGV